MKKVFICLLVIGCSGSTPTGVIPYEEEAVLKPHILQEPVEPPEGIIKCAIKWDGIAICWQVTDSVNVQGIPDLCSAVP